MSFISKKKKQQNLGENFKYLIDKIKLDDFLKKNKYISIKPSKYDGLILEGKFLFNAKTDGF